jgi:hypothetical protein
MDATDPQVRQELERRLAVIDTDEIADEAHAPLPRVDLWALALIVAVSLVCAMVVGL